MKIIYNYDGIDFQYNTPLPINEPNRIRPRGYPSSVPNFCDLGMCDPLSTCLYNGVASLDANITCTIHLPQVHEDVLNASGSTDKITFRNATLTIKVNKCTIDLSTIKIGRFISNTGVSFGNNKLGALYAPCLYLLDDSTSEGLLVANSADNTVGMSIKNTYVLSNWASNSIKTVIQKGESHTFTGITVKLVKYYENTGEFETDTSQSINVTYVNPGVIVQYDSFSTKVAVASWDPWYGNNINGMVTVEGIKSNRLNNKIAVMEKFTHKNKYKKCNKDNRDNTNNTTIAFSVILIIIIITIIIMLIVKLNMVSIE